MNKDANDVVAILKELVRFTRVIKSGSYEYPTSLADWLLAGADIGPIREAGGYASRGVGPHGDNENDYSGPEHEK